VGYYIGGKRYAIPPYAAIYEQVLKEWYYGQYGESMTSLTSLRENEYDYKIF